MSHPTFSVTPDVDSLDLVFLVLRCSPPKACDRSVKCITTLQSRMQHPTFSDILESRMCYLTFSDIAGVALQVSPNARSVGEMHHKRAE